MKWFEKRSQNNNIICGSNTVHCCFLLRRILLFAPEWNLILIRWEKRRKEERDTGRKKKKKKWKLYGKKEWRRDPSINEYPCECVFVGIFMEYWNVNIRLHTYVQWPYPLATKPLQHKLYSWYCCCCCHCRCWDCSFIILPFHQFKQFTIVMLHLHLCTYIVVCSTWPNTREPQKKGSVTLSNTKCNY